jgi:hypothetical protein
MYAPQSARKASFRPSSCWVCGSGTLPRQRAGRPRYDATQEPSWFGTMTIVLLVFEVESGNTLLLELIDESEV